MTPLPALQRRPLAIGGVPLASPLVQAALSGYSDRAMRVLARRHGAAYALCEVLLDQFVATVGTNRRRRKASGSTADVTFTRRKYVTKRERHGTCVVRENAV
jgi:tRNA-dihydrouridine synthase